MQTKRRIHWIAVLAGSLLDNVLSMIIGAVALGMNPEIVSGEFFASAGGALTGLLLGLATVVGGWLAGRIAKEDRFLHGFMVGGFGIFMLLIDSFAGATVTLDMILLQFTATALAGLAGHLSRWTPARESK